MTAGMGPRRTIDQDLPGIGAASVAGAFRDYWSGCLVGAGREALNTLWTRARYRSHLWRFNRTALRSAT